MPRSLNTSLVRLKSSGIRRINALAAQHPGCIALALGEPEFDTPQEIRDEVTRALQRGETHYPPNNGTPFLRRSISEYMSAQGFDYAPDNVIVTDGATEALHATLLAMLEPNDEVIIPTPAFGLYESIVRVNHAFPVFLDTARADFQIDEDALRDRVTPATKAIVICSPNNPTGCIFNAASLDAVARVAAETGIYVICDDVYNRLVYTDGYERFALRHPELREQTVVVDSFSKPWAMTGWRIGWLAADPSLAVQIAKAHQYMVSSAVSFEMPAAAAALSADPAPMLETYRARRARVLAALEKMGLSVVEPAGAFYVFPSIKGTGLTSEQFCTRAIEEAGVGLVPGSCFGSEGYVRLSYCVSDEDLDEGLRRLDRFVAGL
ncbi:pyridoxal phosphate-dependent aminotransferase [Collinsella bouchesdurhonensis]|uniref:pyridoxal phosphate-dependent aminotransferase n=1 Tax=Collinsella bouchesdurhonensis TaxID=1907654 RepID=UPI0035625157